MFVGERANILERGPFVCHALLQPYPQKVVRPPCPWRHLVPTPTTEPQKVGQEP